MVMPSVRSPRKEATTGALATPRAKNFAPGGISRSEHRSVAGKTMDGMLLYRKAIDNSGVRYKHDPRDRVSLARHISWGLFLVFAMLVFSGPRLWVRQWGYRQEQLAERIEQLSVVRDQLKVRLGRMESLSRVSALAELDGLGETDPQRNGWSSPPPIEDESGTTTVARLLQLEGR